MSISISKIRNKEFGKALMRGYNQDEVREFLEFVANSIEEERENRSQAREMQIKKSEYIRQESDYAQEKIEELRKREEIISKLLITTEASRGEILKNARKEAELIIQEAQVKSKIKYTEAMNYVNKVEYQLSKLKEEKKIFLLQTIAQFKVYLDKFEKDPILSKIGEVHVKEKQKRVSAGSAKPRAILHNNQQPVKTESVDDKSNPKK
ncbi:MAG: hypothetical protein B6226_03270 [Candidatus Cloacimonetes bacterium 4572_65]|nr:MAG: hypothetical protein B6226_03270 [Candidatus Cloacimonetes bacterium 4572_65]